MLAKRKKFNLSLKKNREQLRSFKQLFSPQFLVRFSTTSTPLSMVVVGKNVSASAVKRNALKRACYEILEQRLKENDARSYVIRVQKMISPTAIKEALSQQLSRLL